MGDQEAEREREREREERENACTNWLPSPSSSYSIWPTAYEIVMPTLV
jgi:hypothetical protein